MPVFFVLPKGTSRKKAKRENALAEKKIFNICKYCHYRWGVVSNFAVLCMNVLSVCCETFLEAKSRESVLAALTCTSFKS